MRQEEITYLLKQYISNDATMDEKVRLMEALRLFDFDAEEILQMLDAMAIASPADPTYNTETWMPVIRQILQREEKPTILSDEQSRGRIRKMRWYRIAIAASILLILGFGSYFLKQNKTDNKAEITLAEKPGDVDPGQYKAKLTLADGSIIILDSAHTGELTKQGNTAVLNKDGQLVYESSLTTEDSKPLYNILTTARGESYVTTLADGSKVWLNAASSIRFPTAFTGKERRIEITGEAYFEVAPDPARPFHVTVNGVTVGVLGTHFNINAYDDEASVKVTLLEGSVKTSVRQEQRILQPGEQAQVSDGIRVIKGVDLEGVVAWKNGVTSLKDADIKTIMRQLSRWYNVEVEYRGDVPARIFTGEVSRNAKLSDVLEILELSQIHFKIEGKKIIVMP